MWFGASDSHRPPMRYAKLLCDTQSSYAIHRSPMRYTGPLCDTPLCASAEG